MHSPSDGGVLALVGEWLMMLLMSAAVCVVSFLVCTFSPYLECGYVRILIFGDINCLKITIYQLSLELLHNYVGVVRQVLLYEHLRPFLVLFLKSLQPLSLFFLLYSATLLLF